jgi:hypothetical protein
MPGLEGDVLAHDPAEVHQRRKERGPRDLFRRRDSATGPAEEWSGGTADAGGVTPGNLGVNLVNGATTNVSNRSIHSWRNAIRAGSANRRIKRRSAAPGH